MRLNRLRSPTPLRQLLYVEWILVAMAVFMTLPFATLEPNAGVDWGKLSIILLFGGMGLRLPQRHWHKLLYTAAELGLIWLLTATGGMLPIMMRLLPLMGFIVIIRSCQLFQARERGTVLGAILVVQAGVAFYAFDIPDYERLSQNLSTPPEAWQIAVLKTHALVFFSMAMVFVSLLVNALLSAYQKQQALAAAHEKLRQYAAKIETQATLHERNRIAREIHDSLGHSLTAQTILLENALLFLPQDIHRAQDYVVNAKNTAYQTLREVSRSVSVLRTGSRGEPLSKTIPTLVNDICPPANITAQWAIDVPEALPEEVNLALFRIAQEALTNAVKHSGATEVTVKLSAKCDRLHLQVLDNGQGFDPSQNTTGFGLQGMQERASHLGGTYQLWSAPKEGCRISVILPLPTRLDNHA